MYSCALLIKRREKNGTKNGIVVKLDRRPKQYLFIYQGSWQTKQIALPSHFSSVSTASHRSSGELCGTNLSSFIGWRWFVHLRATGGLLFAHFCFFSWLVVS